MISRILLILAILIFLWAAVLGFGFVDDAELTEDYGGWLGLGLALGFASFIPWPDNR